MSADIFHFSLNDTEPAPLRAGESHVERVIGGLVDRHRHKGLAVELPSEGHAAKQTVPCTFDVALKEERPVGIQEADANAPSPAV